MDIRDFIKTKDLQIIANEGALIYEGIKSEYEDRYFGKHLAIELESRKGYLGETSADAVMVARKAHPGKVFYVVKIGSSAVETMASYFLT